MNGCGGLGICRAGMLGSLLIAGALEAQRPAGGIAREPDDGGVWSAAASVQRVPASLLEDRRPVVILPAEPADAGESDIRRTIGVSTAPPAEPLRMPEGFVLGGRIARIEPGSPWHIAHIEPREGLFTPPPLRLLPNQQLAIVESIIHDRPPGPRFVVTGRVTEFQGHNYLLIESVAVMPEETARATVSPETPATAGITKTAETATEPAGGTVPTAEPTAQDVLRALMATEPLRGVLPAGAQPAPVIETMPAGRAGEGLASPPGASVPVTGERGGERLWPEGTVLVDQVGRVVPGEPPWWTLVFEDRGRAAGRSPIRLLPSRLLETAIALSEGGTTGVFLISGEVTTYRGVNYLLLRKVLVRRDMGNLR